VDRPEFIWLTNANTSERVGVRLDHILLLEQKRAEDGGAVALYLAHGKEIRVQESFRAIRAAIEREAGRPERSGVSAVA
jgi:hypothetical protein